MSNACVTNHFARILTIGLAKQDLDHIHQARATMRKMMQTKPLTIHFVVQEMRTWKEAEQAGKDSGFELVLSYDVAVASPVCGPW